MRIATAMDDGDEGRDDLERFLERSYRFLKRSKKQLAESNCKLIILAGTAKFGEPSPAVVERVRQSFREANLAAMFSRLETATSWGEWLNSA